MAITRAILALVLSWCLTLGSTQLLRGQIIKEPLPDSTGGVQQANAEIGSGAQSGLIQQVGWPSIPLPKVTLPQITMPKVTMPKLPPLWPSSGDDQSPALLSPFVSGFKKVSEGTRKAWEGTIELFSVGSGKGTSNSAARNASPSQPSLWQRLVSPAPEHDGPQTVGEFMSQKRLDP